MVLMPWGCTVRAIIINQLPLILRRRTYQYIQRIQQIKHIQRLQFHTSNKMESQLTSAALYTTISLLTPGAGDVPKDTKDLKHHVKSGKGFLNPWDSYIEQTGPQIGGALLW